jgi:UDPglucose 6-dehydrogenase
MNMKLAVFGLGKLGLCTAACFAARGHQVTGFDLNEALLEDLAAGRCPIREPGLPEFLEEARPNFSVSRDIPAMVAGAQASLIIVPTPSGPDHRFLNTHVCAVLEQIAPALRDLSHFHVVNVVSTVMPATCNLVFQPLLEARSGRVCGQDFGLAYNPEFIALGSVLHHFLNPDLVLIGASDARSGALMRQLYDSTCRNRPRVAVMSLLNAELTKLALNCYVTLKISFANELAGLCERLPGADVDVITDALGADRRIGEHCLKGGLGFGGPCFPRDNLAFQALAAHLGLDLHLAAGVVEVNADVVDRVTAVIFEHAPRPGPVALLGLAYKPGTPVVEESQSLTLAAMGYEVRVHDPQALDEARQFLGGQVTYAADAGRAAAGAAAVVLLTPWPEYADLPWEEWAAKLRPPRLLLDCWRLLRGRPLSAFAYQALGLGDQSGDAPIPHAGPGPLPSPARTAAGLG